MTDLLPYLIGGAVVVGVEALILFLIWLPRGGCDDGGGHQWETFQLIGRLRCSKCGIIEDEHGQRFAGWDEYLTHKRSQR